MIRKNIYLKFRGQFSFVLEDQVGLTRMLFKK